jgi:DNA-binding transcriptional regulator YbjK
MAMTDTETAGPTSRCGPGCPTCADLRRAAVALVGSFGLGGVTPRRLAQLAGLPLETMARHACGDVDRVIPAAYQEQIEGLQARFAARLHRARSRDAGLRDATADLLAYLARHADVAAFVTVEVLKGGRELLELREALRLRTVANVRRELARFDRGAVASDLQIEMLVATMGHTIARHVEAGRTAELPDALEPALAMAGACVPLPALT